VNHRPRRRWLRRLAIILSGLAVMVLAVFGWAWFSLDSSAVARALIWMDADVGDQYRFPARVIPAGEDVSPIPAGDEIDLGASPLGDGVGFDSLLRRNHTLSFLVVHDDRLVYERYFGGSSRETLHTSLSVAKSILSAVVGFAIEEGLIEGVRTQ
jgi:CubicO group peptidase (beta-lactamase class C family)